MKTAKPPVDFLSSVHPAQSALENELTIVEGDDRIINTVYGVFKKAKNTFDSSPVYHPWSVKVLSHLVDDIGNIWTCQSQILQCSNYVVLLHCILRAEKITIMCG
jgi:hypothetical protein